MPTMVYTPKTYNDISALSPGWHPAFLLDIGDELTPDHWAMYEQSPRHWKWKFAVWEVPTLIDRQAPERQSAISTQKFTPKGRQPASKAYTWAAALLERQIPPGESVDLIPMCPFPCRVKVEPARTSGYINIVDVEPCHDLTHYLTPEMRDKLAAFLETFSVAPEPLPQPPPPATPPAPPAGMQRWGGAPGTPPAPVPPMTTGAPAKVTW